MPHPPRRPAVLAGLLVLLASAALAAPLCPTTPVTGGHQGTPSNCCAQFQCAQGSPGLANGRQSVVLAVVDDESHCLYGYMGGRCAGPRTGPTGHLNRCTAAVCSNATWLGCSVDGDCPPGGTCGAAKVCSNAAGTACTNAAVDCPPPVGLETIDCVFPGCGVGESCTNGYCGQCASDADCDGAKHEMCVEGLCSPRAACQNDFQCARSVGTCQAGVCTPSGAPCGTDADCHDVCSAGLCQRTPAQCNTNADCGTVGTSGYACTTSRSPLRLNDLSCRGRQPGDAVWEFSRSTVAPAGRTTTYTPTLDALARDGAVFPRARVNGQNCKPTRAAMLLGRYLRHRSPSTSGQCRVTGAGCTAAEFGKSNTAHCPGVTNVCDPLHSIAWWLEHSPAAIDTYTIAAGKTEVRAASLLGFDTAVQNRSSPDFARFFCDASCENALAHGAQPTAAVAAGQPKSYAEVVDAVRAPNGAIDANGVLQRPFFLWLAPKVPHEGYTAPPFFRNLYPTSLGGTDKGLDHQARTSHFDAGLAAFVDELKRTCVCDAQPGPMTSLWDHTVLGVIADNAFLLPSAKNDGAAAPGNEDAHRTPLILNTPAHRNGTQAPHVLDEQSQAAGSPDLMPTLLEYLGMPDPDAVDDYPLNRALQPFVQDGMAAGFVRSIYYGHSTNGTQARQTSVGLRAYAVPGPSVLGLCTNPGSATPVLNHRRPCLGDTDCGCTAGAGCCTIGARRCITNPAKACGDDRDCVTAVCQPAVGGSRCVGSPYADFNGQTCTTDVDCVPAGICRPPMLKAYQTGSVARSVTQLFDVNFDPDQTTNLLQVEPTYLGSGTTCPANGQPTSLGQTLDCCLKELWTLDASKVWARGSFGCPTGLRPSLPH